MSNSRAKTNRSAHPAAKSVPAPIADEFICQKSGSTPDHLLPPFEEIYNSIHSSIDSLATKSTPDFSDFSSNFFIDLSATCLAHVGAAHNDKLLCISSGSGVFPLACVKSGIFSYAFCYEKNAGFRVPITVVSSDMGIPCGLFYGDGYEIKKSHIEEAQIVLFDSVGMSDIDISRIVSQLNESLPHGRGVISTTPLPSLNSGFSQQHRTTYAGSHARVSKTSNNKMRYYTYWTGPKAAYANGLYVLACRTRPFFPAVASKAAVAAATITTPSIKRSIPEDDDDVVIVVPEFVIRPDQSLVTPRAAKRTGRATGAPRAAATPRRTPRADPIAAPKPFVVPDNVQRPPITRRNPLRPVTHEKITPNNIVVREASPLLSSAQSTVPKEISAFAPASRKRAIENPEQVKPASRASKHPLTIASITKPNTKNGSLKSSPTAGKSPAIPHRQPASKSIPYPTPQQRAEKKLVYPSHDNDGLGDDSNTSDDDDNNDDDEDGDEEYDDNFCEIVPSMADISKDVLMNSDVCFMDPPQIYASSLADVAIQNELAPKQFSFLENTAPDMHENTNDVYMYSQQNQVHSSLDPLTDTNVFGDMLDNYIASASSSSSSSTSPRAGEDEVQDIDAEFANHNKDIAAAAELPNTEAPVPAQAEAPIILAHQCDICNERTDEVVAIDSEYEKYACSACHFKCSTCKYNVRSTHRGNGDHPDICINCAPAEDVASSRSTVKCGECDEFFIPETGASEPYKCLDCIML
jgi:hypothetical protein